MERTTSSEHSRLPRKFIAAVIAMMVGMAMLLALPPEKALAAPVGVNMVTDDVVDTYVERQEDGSTYNYTYRTLSFPHSYSRTGRYQIDSWSGFLGVPEYGMVTGHFVRWKMTYKVW